MTRYEFYNNLELFNRSKEITEQEEKDKVQTELNELKHYGTLGQKWGVRKWQNPDGTFNEAGKERYFGKSKAKTTKNEENGGTNGTTKKNTEEDKIGNKESDVKDYLKFRNKMLKERTRDDLNSWYRDKQKKADKQLVKDAKKVDKQQEKMYKNQLKDFYDNPEDLVSDLDKMYKVGGKENKDIPTVADKLYPNKKYELNDEDYNKFQEITYDISSKMVENATNNKGQKFRENQEKLEEELLKVPFVKKHFDEMKKIYQETGDWDKAEEHYWEIPDLAEQGDFLITTIQNHISDDQKIGGLFSKKNKSNVQYQNEDGSLTEEGKQFYATHDEKDINKNLDMKKYNAWKDEMKKGNIFDDEKKLDKLTKELGLPEKGEYKWEDDVKTVLKLRKDLYNTIEGNKQLSDNADNIVKLVKAKENGNEEEYNRIFDGIKDSDKSIVESFVNDINKTKDWYKDAEETMKEVNSSQTQNIKKYMENIWGDPKIRYDKSDYHKEGKVSHPGVYDLEDYSKGNSKATQSIKELDKNADAHFDKILDKLYNNLMDFSGTLNVWDEDHNKLSKSEFKDYMKDQKYKLINSGSVSDNGNVSLYLNDADLYWGHVFGIDYNPVTGEFHYRGIEG